MIAPDGDETIAVSPPSKGPVRSTILHKLE
jgi:hypothetical protein